MLQIVQNLTLFIKKQYIANGQFLWFSSTKKCVQAVFYFLTAAEKHTLLFYRLTGSIFSMLPPTEQIITLVLSYIQIFNFNNNNFIQQRVKFIEV